MAEYAQGQNPAYSNLQPLSYPTQSYGSETSSTASYQQHHGNMPSQAPSSAQSEVMLWFQAVDVDRSGYISAAELRQALSNANWTMFSEDSCRLMIGMFDRDHGNSIDIHEFQQLWQYLQQWQQVFRQVDKNQSGYIEHDELAQAIASMGYQFSPEFFQVAVARFDYTKQQRINLDAFIVCCVLLQRLTEAFKEKDSGRTGQAKVSYEDFMLMSLNGIP